MSKQYNKMKLSITEEICKITLSLLMSPGLTSQQQEYVINKVNQFGTEVHK